MFDINKFLTAREERVKFQTLLIKEFSLPLITVRTNYPGENKSEILAKEIAKSVSNEIELLFFEKIKYKNKTNTEEGDIYFYIIDDIAEHLKKLCIDFEENHILGRCVDLDVYSTNGEGLSRKIFNLPKRKCFLCDNLAFLCGRSFSHSHEEIKDFLFKKYFEYQEYLRKKESISDELASLAVESMVYEVSSSPSFGLVSPLTQGSHTDMNFFTFLDSSFALKDGLKKMAEIAFSSLPLDVIFLHIRDIGKHTEKKMFKATKGINTHKGMIFLLGIVITAVSHTIYKRESFDKIKFYIQGMTKNILKDFNYISKNNNSLSHGEKLFLKYGFLGIRGEVKEGLKIVFDGSFQIFKTLYEKDKCINKASLHTLIFLMSKVMDSTIVYRHNLETLETVQKEMTAIFNKGIENYPIEFFYELEKKYINKNISPGGSADLLAVTIFLFRIYEKKVLMN